MSDRTERIAYKDWFDAEATARLGAQVRAVHPTFPEKEFRRRAFEGLEALEFHARIEQFSGALRSTLSEDTPASLAILTESLPPVLPDTEAVTDGWLQWPVGNFIGALERQPSHLSAPD